MKSTENAFTPGGNSTIMDLCSDHLPLSIQGSAFYQAYNITGKYFRLPKAVATAPSILELGIQSALSISGFVFGREKEMSGNPEIE